MSLFIAWLVFPLLLGLLSLGSGLLVEKAAGTRVPGVLLLPLGLALIVVVSQITTNWDATAELSTPLVVLVAASGFALSLTRLKRIRPDPWASAAALGVLGIYAAPVVLSGHATFAGYTQLGDPAIHFVLIDRVMEHGRDLSGLEPSSYRAALDAYFDTAYPLGSHTALGAVRPMVGQDVAWVFQPYIAFLAALVALVLYSLGSSVIRSRIALAVLAGVATQTALLYGFSLQGSIKEVATVWIVGLVVALLPVSISAGGSIRALIPLSVAVAAGMGILSLAAAPWLAPILLAYLIVVVLRWRRTGPRLAFRTGAALLAMSAALSFPTLALASTFARTTTSVVTSPKEKGNLVEPLDRLQAFGIWIAKDFRLRPQYSTLTYILLAVAIASAAAGLLWVIRRRAAIPALYIAVSVLGWSYATIRGSPWADAKALMILSPAVMLATMLAPAALYDSGRRFAAALLAAPIVAGVLLSNALAYHHVHLAPRGRLGELQDIGRRFAGKGPALYPDFEEFGKHFLRGADPIGWSDPWQPLRKRGRFGLSYDLDEIRTDYVLRFPMIVVRRSPAASRPPAAYRRVFAGRYYEVWRRPVRSPLAVLLHRPLGRQTQASGYLSCPALRQIAERAARSDRRLAYVVRARSIALLPSSRAPARRQRGEETLVLHGSGDERAEGGFRVISAGTYELWIGGSIGRGYRVLIDGRKVGSISYQLNEEGQYAYVRDVTLGTGRHVVKLLQAGVRLHPGNASGDGGPGAVVFAPEASEGRRVEYGDARGALGLCGRPLDWVEIVDHGS